MTRHGCALTPKQRREEALLREARQWNDDLRWARWEVVRESLPPDDARLFAERAALIGDDLMMADSEVTQIAFGQPSIKALVTVKIDWYTKRDMTVRSTTLQQRWEQRDGRWLMVEQRRTRGARFPLVTEPADLKAGGNGDAPPAGLPAR